MSPTTWGPPVWRFFHTLAEKMNEDKFQELGPQLFNLIRKICRVLPCPDCSMHATQFLSKINFSTIKTKTDFKNILYIFHNVVNKRKNKALYDNNNLSIYANNNIVNTYNQFVAVYQTKGNMKLITDSFQRQLVLNDLKKWLLINMKYFI